MEVPGSATCIILAAGAAQRFGGRKQLARLDGRPLIEHVLGIAQQSAAVEHAVVVLGAHADEIEARADLSGARVVRCQAWESGQARSLQAGLAHSVEARVVVVLLGDEPTVPPAAIDRVVAAVIGGESAARASWNGQARHPVAFAPSLIPELAELSGDVGARTVLDRIGVALVACDDLAGPPTDIDTTNDLDRLTEPDGDRQTAESSPPGAT